VAGLSFLLIFGISLYWLGWSPWRLIHRFVPGASAIRAMTRIALLLLIPLSLGLVATLERFKTRHGLVLLCTLLIIAEQVQSPPFYDKLADRQRVAALAAQVPRDATAFFYAHFPGPSYLSKETYWIDAMWAQMLTGVPTVNGYSGWAPIGYEKFAPEAKSPAEKAVLVMQLQNWLLTFGQKNPSISAIPLDRGVLFYLGSPSKQ
jgi:hypothetical protein